MVYFWSLFWGTFILEDVALGSAAALLATEKMNFTQAFSACFFGIVVGDLILYIFGFFGSQSNFPIVKNLRIKVQSVNPQRLTAAIILCRFIPGTRLVTYLAAGFFRYSVLGFLGITFLTVGIWVSLALFGSYGLTFGKDLHWAFQIVAVLAVLTFFRTFLFWTQNPWQRRAAWHSWRKWLHFEFWPAWLFYPPVILYVVGLMIRYRSVTLPVEANPQILYGGLVGESKWSFYQHLVHHSAALKTDFLNPEDLSNIPEYPFVLKPDVGQRGFAVRIIKNQTQLSEYVKEAKFPILIQEFCSWKHEAGVFYVKYPKEKKGFIFSVTDKKFPFVVGDGKTNLGNLILKDSRARIIAQVYFDRHETALDTVVSENEIFILSECGNHCQGALFFNGKNLVTPELTHAIEEVANLMPDFYFGRFDIRYESVEKLKKGLGFKIIEVNGAGSEATHIWDPKTKLLDAYRTLFNQWKILFEIGGQVRHLRLNKNRITLLGLAQVYFAMLNQNKKLNRSS